jgi:hypothetical protein
MTIFPQVANDTKEAVYQKNMLTDKLNELNLTSNKLNILLADNLSTVNKIKTDLLQVNDEIHLIKELIIKINTQT